MPKVHFVKKARKGIDGVCEKGESYYWWKFRYGGKHRSKTCPRPSQLTQSDFLSSWYGAEEAAQDLAASLRHGGTSLSEATDTINSIAGDLESLKDETEEKADNVESAFENGSPVIDQLRERVERCEAVIEELECIAGEVDTTEEETDGELDEDTPNEEAYRVADELDSVDWSVE